MKTKEYLQRHALRVVARLQKRLSEKRTIDLAGLDKIIMDVEKEMEKEDGNPKK